MGIFCLLTGSAVKRVKSRSRAIEADPGDPRKLAALMSQLMRELREPGFPDNTRLSVDFSDARGRASQGELLISPATSRSLTEFIGESISYLKALLNANGIGNFLRVSYRSRYDKCKSDRQFCVACAIDHAHRFNPSCWMKINFGTYDE